MSHLHNNNTTENLTNALYAGRFGIEIEEHRVQTGSKTLSRHPHPDTLGDRRVQPYFQTDFSESLEEVVTAPKSSSAKALTHLHELQLMLNEELVDDEIIWPLSMPPYLTNDDVNFLNTHFDRPWYQEYRDILLSRYGSFQHIMAGVHVNFSPSDDVITWYRQRNNIASHSLAKNNLFFQIAQQVTGYRWILTYLFGASPVSENPADNIPNDRYALQPVRSWRASDFGFANRPEITVDYTDFQTHVDQIQKHIIDGDFYDKSEFYGPVRLKAPGNMTDLVNNGAEYMEFRMFDIDPFTQDGISQNALSFLHLLIIDAIVNPTTWEQSTLDDARTRNQIVALQHPNEQLPDNAIAYADDLFLRLEKLVQSAPISQKNDFQSALSFARSAVKQPKLTIGAQLSKAIENESLIPFGLQQGAKISAQRHQNTWSQTLQHMPTQLQQVYIQAHKLGFDTHMDSTEQTLNITYNNGPLQTLTGNQDLTQYI
ncbi:glutamate--cysteine ligase [Leuconostoc inhae]|uniref:glutamate--cysteine ligase n=1 Tax=Leuconostoc inhae TaxID=178001 RepID=UPI001C7CF913|nr:glutamate--cysteine ligase [Leuconostoc inhae]